jgi:hypothetical protein
MGPWAPTHLNRSCSEEDGGRRADQRTTATTNHHYGQRGSATGQRLYCGAGAPPPWFPPNV